MKVSIYKKYNSVSPAKETDVYKVLESIKNGDYSEQIKDVRFLINDKPKRDIAKQKLPLVGFGGTFSTRGNSNLKQHSGLACLDFDHLEDVIKTKKQINKDKYTLSSFVSPSGDGLKVLVRIPLVSNDKDYKSFYSEVQKHFNKYGETDDSTKDIARATYLSYDPELYLNIESELFTDRFIPKEIITKTVNVPISDMDEIAQRVVKWFSKKWTTGQNRNNNLFILSSAFNDFGVSKDVAFSYCSNYISSDFSENEILKLVESAYRNVTSFGSKAFEDTKKVSEIKKLVYNEKTVQEVREIVGDFKGLEIEYNEVKDKINPNEFWFYTDKEVIKLATFRFLNYLENNNISKYYPDNNSDTYLFIKKENNFVSDFGESKIKDFTLTDLRKRGNIDAFELMANNNNNFSSNYLSMINTTDVKINKDTKKSSYIYYNNFAVKTTAEGSELIDYKDIKDLIWKNQVINRDIKLNSESDGEFKTFIWRLSGEDKERYYTLKSVIGYLMHSYQNDSKPKAIIFNDEMISDDIPNGGSGKGLIHKAIGHIKNIVIEDGKKFDPRGQFAYQKVNKDTQIFLMDDVPKNFSFESLFSIVTEGMTVEKKGQDAFQIPFEESPKISITTNYTIKGDGASHHRRVFEVEIANHYNDNYTPEDEFNHQFFSEWDKAEWAEFDNFMIRCIQFFLKNGLVESNKVNLEFRKLKNNLGNEFIEFMEAQKFDGEALDRKLFRDDFNKQYPTIARFNSAQKFNKKVKDYCSYHKIDFEERKFNGVVNFFIEDNKEIDLTEEIPF